MPQVIQLPTVPETSLGNLGSIILGSATDYAQNRRADQLRAEQRTQRLQDIADERTHQERQHQQGRTERLQDITAQDRVAFLNELVRIGLLAQADMDANNLAAIQRASAEFAASERGKLYKAAVDTGDLALTDLGDPAKVQAGLAAYSARLSKRTGLQESNQGNAQTRAGQLVDEEQKLAAQADVLNAKLGAPQPQPTPDQIRLLAIQMATAQAGGKQPSREQIAQAADAAEQQLSERLIRSWAQDRQDALVQRQIIAARLSDIKAEENTLTSKFGTVGVAKPTIQQETPQAAARPPVDRAAIMQSIVDQIKKQQDMNSPPPNTATSPLANPTNEPMIQQENQRRVGQNWQTNLADPYNALMDRQAQVRQKIQEIRSGTQTASAPASADFGFANAAPVQDTSAQAQALSQLLQEDSALTQQLMTQRPKTFFRGSAIQALAPVMQTQQSNVFGSTPYSPSQGASWYNPLPSQTPPDF